MTDDQRAPGAALRVRLVTPGFPPARGGVEEHCHQLAVRLSAGGDRVSVLTASRAGRVGPARRPDTYRAWRTTSMSLSPRLTVAGAFGPAADTDITHVHSYHASSGFAAIAGVRRPIVFTPHYHGSGHSALARGLHRGYQLAGRAMFAAADAVICVSDAERAALVRDFPGIAERIRVIPNGVDRATIRTAAPFPAQPPTALVVGRLEPYKHVDAVIRAMAVVPTPSQLVIIGDGSESRTLRRLVDELGLGTRARVLGAVDTEELHRWMRTARVLVSLSDHEAAGARVVLSDIPAHREITGKWLGSTAEAVATDNVPAVADAVRRALARTDRTHVDVPDWSDVARSTRAVYREVIDARRDHPRPGRPSSIENGA